MTRRERLMVIRLENIISKGEGFLRGVRWFNKKHFEVLDYEGKEDDVKGLREVNDRARALMNDLHEFLNC